MTDIVVHLMTPLPSNSPPPRTSKPNICLFKLNFDLLCAMLKCQAMIFDQYCIYFLFII